MVTTPLEWLARFNIAAAGEDERESDITQLSNGNWLVSWTSDVSTGAGSPAGSDILGQIYNPLGVAVGGHFRLNTIFSADNESSSSIVALDGGGFAVTYNDLEVVFAGSLTFDTDIIVEVFDNAGGHVSAALIKNDPGGSSIPTHLNPQIASSSATSTMITWLDLANGDILARAYDPSTGTLGSEFTVYDGITGTGEGVSSPEITALDNGNYAIVWSNINNGIDDQMLIKIVDSSGAQVLGTTIVYDVYQDLGDPSITTLTNGKFAIGFTGDNSGGTNGLVGLVIYNEDGSKYAGVYFPTTTSAGNQVGTAIAAVDGGGLVVFWFDENTNDLHGQRYLSNGVKLGVEFDVVNFGSTDISNIEAIRMEDGRIAITWTAEFSGGTDGDIQAAIWDPRDAANSPAVYTSKQIIGTINDDFYNVVAADESVFGYDGHDQITFTGSLTASNTVYDGGSGTDVLVLDGSGTVDLQNAELVSIERITSSTFPGTREIIFRADQLATGQLATDAVISSRQGSPTKTDTLKFVMGTDTDLNLSGLTFSLWDNEFDSIEIIGDGDGETIIGSSQDDIIEGGAGADYLDGGGGIDTLSYAGSSASVSVQLVDVGISNFGGGSGDDDGDVFLNFENIIGSAQDDILGGLYSSASTIMAGGGNDLLVGYDGANALFGEGAMIDSVLAFLLSQQAAYSMAARARMIASR